MPLQWVGMNASDERIEQVILAGLAGVCGVERLERLGRRHGPTYRHNRAVESDETEGVQTVIGAVRESGRDRMTADQLYRPGGFRVFGQKRIHRGRIGFSRRRIQR